MTTTGREILEPLLLNNRDVLLPSLYCHSPQICVELRSKVECPAILLTDTLEPVVGDKARVVLAAAEGRFFVPFAHRTYDHHQ
jgi:hypothetical protein